jgi:hypothetical protein
MVYGLTDPRDGRIHYIGKTANQVSRLTALRSAARRTTKPRPVHLWVRDLLVIGIEPGFVVLEGNLSESDAYDREIYWIAYGRTAGWPLTNVAGGGQASFLTLPPEIVELGKTRKAAKMGSKETRAKMRAAWVIRRDREASSPKLPRPPITEDLRARLRAAHANVSADTRSKMSISARARIRIPMTAAHKAKIGAANRDPSPEKRAKMSAAAIIREAKRKSRL